MVEQAYISFKDASFGYGKGDASVEVLNIPELNFFKGEIVGLAGMNGTGKSTLLRSACGLLPLLRGSLFIEGKNFGTYSSAELAKQIAIVLTEKIGGFNLKVKDVVAAGRIPYTGAFHNLMPHDEEKITEAMLRCGIEEWSNKDVLALSDGMFQKTMIAKALAQQTAALLLDEPGAFLDFASRHRLFELLVHLARQDQKCIVVSSHDLELLTKYCDNIAVISDGRLEMMKASDARGNVEFRKIAGGYL